jgi:cyclase
MRLLMDAGADKVAWRSGLIRCPGAMARAAATFGAQACVASIDVQDGQVFGAAAAPADFAYYATMQIGAGEILLTSMDREGTMAGYDLDLIREVCSAVDVPVIAHGGCSGYEDMLKAIRAGASAVAAGALFQFTDCTPRGAAEYLHSHGIEVRL